MTGPLSGVRVLDLTRLLAGPFCTMILADLGADVIKIERPGQGDPARNLGPLVGDNEAAYFISINRGKKSITLNLFSEEGQNLVHSMLPHCDVLVENFVPGTMARFGLEYEKVKSLHPGLIYASISGFGQDGPESQRPALDIVVQAMGGLISVTGQPDGPLTRPGASLGDSIAGVFTALSILAALYQREATGQGQYIDISMLDCQVMMMENALSRYFSTGAVPGPIGARHPVAAPFQIFQASDRQLRGGAAQRRPRRVASLLRGIGPPGPRCGLTLPDQPRPHGALRRSPGPCTGCAVPGKARIALAVRAHGRGYPLRPRKQHRRRSRGRTGQAPRHDRLDTS